MSVSRSVKKLGFELANTIKPGCLVSIVLMAVLSLTCQGCSSGKVDRNEPDTPQWEQNSRPEGCAFKPVSSTSAVESQIFKWLSTQKAPRPSSWSSLVNRNRARILLLFNEGRVDITITLGAQCDDPPAIVSKYTGFSDAWPNSLDWKDLVEKLPFEKVDSSNRTFPKSVVTPGIARSKNPPGMSSLGLEVFGKPLWMGIAIILLVLALAFQNRHRWPSALIFTGIAALITYAALPIMVSPFSFDSPVQHYLDAKYDIFADWAHPFLAPMLLHPVATLTSEPWILRILPLLYVILGGFLVLVATNRKSGRAVAVLAALWFASEVRRKHGILDLSDWDLAATFLLSWLIAFQYIEEGLVKGLRSWVLVICLLVIGAFSSYLMAVPLGIWGLVSYVGWKRSLLPWQPFVGFIIGFVPIAIMAVLVFAAGQHWYGHIAQQYGQFILDMLFETPFGRKSFMLIPLMLGLAWLIHQRKSPSAQFVLGSIVAVPVALLLALRFSSLYGTYYVGLVTPLLIYASANGVAWVLDIAADFVASNSEKARRLLKAAILVAIALYTVTLTDPVVIGSDGGAENLSAFDDEISGNDLPILTNLQTLWLFIHHREIKGARLKSVSPLDLGIISDLVSRLRRSVKDLCNPIKGETGLDRGYYLFLVYNGNGSPSECLSGTVAQCRELFPETQGPLESRTQRFFYYKCPPPLETALPR